MIQGMLSYIVDDASKVFQGLNRDHRPTLSAEIAHMSPLFLDLLEQVHATGVPVHFSKTELTAGGQSLGSGPGVMYRSDNPAKPGEREGK